MVELLTIDGFEVVRGHLVSAGFANVFGRVRADVHLRSASAEGEAREEVNDAFGGLAARLLPGQDRGAFVPEFAGNNGFDLGIDPLIFGLQFPGFRSIIGLGVVPPVEAFGRCVIEQVCERGIREGRSAAGAVATLIQDTSNRLLPPVFDEELMDQNADRRLIRIRFELLVAPLVAEGRGPAERLAEFGADRNGRPNAFGDLLPLPLRHRGDHREEEPAGGRAGVDRFLEGDQVSAFGSKDLGEFEQLFRVAGKASELGENQPLDLSGPDVSEHALCVWMTDNGFTAHGLQPIQFRDLPAFGFGIGPGAPLMVIGAVAARLILRRDPNPDPDRLW